MLYASNVLLDGIQLSETEEPSPISLSDWSIRPITINDIPMILAVNHLTLMPAIIPGTEFLRVSVEKVLAQVVKQMCYQLAINPDKTKRYAETITTGKVTFRNSSTDFLLERAFRYYISSFEQLTPEELEGYEKNDLLVGLAIESVTLADQERFGRQETPMINFTDRVVNQVRIPITTKNKENRLIKRWQALDNDVQLANPLDASLRADQEVYDQLVGINTELISDLMVWLDSFTTTDKSETQRIKDSLDQFLNDYLTQHCPMSIIDDLTSPTDFLLQWEALSPEDTDPKPILVALRYLIMYMQSAKMISVKDSRILIRAIQVVIADYWGEELNVDLNLGYKHLQGQPDKTTQKFIDLMKKFPDAFYDFLRNLSPRERLTMIDQLLQLNKEDAKSSWEEDNLWKADGLSERLLAYLRELDLPGFVPGLYTLRK